MECSEWYLLYNMYHSASWIALAKVIPNLFHLLPIFEELNILPTVVPYGEHSFLNS